jgi:hypothetical protein
VRNANGRTILFVFIVILGGIAGSLIGDLIGSNIKSLNFIRNVYTIGTSQPIYLNLKVIGITFGINFNFNIMSIMGIILAIILIRKW